MEDISKEEAFEVLTEIVEYMNDKSVTWRDISDDIICDILEKHGIATVRTYTSQLKSAAQ